MHAHVGSDGRNADDCLNGPGKWYRLAPHARKLCRAIARVEVSLDTRDLLFWLPSAAHRPPKKKKKGGPPPPPPTPPPDRKTGTC